VALCVAVSHERYPTRAAREGRPDQTACWVLRLAGGETKELGNVRTLLEYVGADDPLAAIRDVRPGKPDPPDAIGTRDDGALVALEVTELVDQEVTARNVRAARKTIGQDPLERMKDTVQRVWDETGVIDAIQALLTEKDGKRLHGGPFTEYVVVLHTDEMMLTHGDAEPRLRGHKFNGLRQITGVRLLSRTIRRWKAIRRSASTSARSPWRIGPRGKDHAQERDRDQHHLVWGQSWASPRGKRVRACGRARLVRSAPWRA